MSSTTATAAPDKQRLGEIEASIASLRDQRATEAKQQQKLIDTARKASASEIAAIQSKARSSKDRMAKIDDALASLLDEQTGMLREAAGLGGRIDGLHAAGHDSAAVKRLAEQPGAWLSSVLAGPTADAAVAQMGIQVQAAAPSQLGVSNVSTETQSAALIDLLAPYTVALRSGIAMLPIDTTKIRIPRFTDLPVAGWTGEGGSFPESAPGMEMVDVLPGKVGLVSPLSVELWEDLTPGMLAMVQRQLVRAVALAYDNGILFGDGTDDAPIGVANTSGVLSVTQPIVGLKPFAQALAVLISQNAFPGALVINPLDLGLIFEQTEFLGDSNSNVPLWKAAIERAADGAFSLELPYFGTPVWPTPAAPRGKALMYDPREIVAVMRRQADIALNPFHDFGDGMVALRSYLRGNVLVGQAKGVVAITLGSNITATAATDVITSAAHGLADGSTVQFTDLTGGAGLDASTTYYVEVLDANTFKVSDTPGGAAVDITTDATAGVVIRV